MSTQAPIDPATGEVLPADSPAVRKPSRLTKLWRSYGLALLFVLLVLGAVGDLRARGRRPQVPVPRAVADRRVVQGGLVHDPLAGDVGLLREVLVGFAISVVFGIGIAIVLHMFGPLRRAGVPAADQLADHPHRRASRPSW